MYTVKTSPPRPPTQANLDTFSQSLDARHKGMLSSKSSALALSSRSPRSSPLPKPPASHPTRTSRYKDIDLHQGRREQRRLRASSSSLPLPKQLGQTTPFPAGKGPLARPPQRPPLAHNSCRILITWRASWLRAMQRNSDREDTRPMRIRKSKNLNEDKKRMWAVMMRRTKTRAHLPHALRAGQQALRNRAKRRRAAGDQGRRDSSQQRRPRDQSPERRHRPGSRASPLTTKSSASSTFVILRVLGMRTGSSFSSIGPATTNQKTRRGKMKTSCN